VAENKTWAYGLEDNDFVSTLPSDLFEALVAQDGQGDGVPPRLVFAQRRPAPPAREAALAQIAPSEDRATRRKAGWPAVVISLTLLVSLVAWPMWPSL